MLTIPGRARPPGYPPAHASLVVKSYQNLIWKKNELFREIHFHEIFREIDFTKKLLFKKYPTAKLYLIKMSIIDFWYNSDLRFEFDFETV